MKSREEHIEWCKKRALEHLNAGELQFVVASMVSDLGKHPSTRNMPGRDALATIGMKLFLDHDVDGLRRWIEGFR